MLCIHCHTHKCIRTYEERTPAVDLLGGLGRLSVRVAVSKEGASTRLIMKDAVVVEIEMWKRDRDDLGRVRDVE